MSTTLSATRLETIANVLSEHYQNVPGYLPSHIENILNANDSTVKPVSLKVRDALWLSFARQGHAANAATRAIFEAMGRSEDVDSRIGSLPA